MKGLEKDDPDMNNGLFNQTIHYLRGSGLKPQCQHYIVYIHFVLYFF